MHGRSTKQRRSAMRRRQAEKGRCTMAQFQSALNALHDAGRPRAFTRTTVWYPAPPPLPWSSDELFHALILSETTPNESPFRTLVYAETPKETK